jgi:cobalt-zinc-cadmium efflux system protein
MGSDHNHAHAASGNEKLLLITLGLTATFMVAEIVGGFMTQSLALLSDAAHMFTDVAALAVSLAAIRIGKRPADASRTFGYYRFEILAAAFNASILFLVALYILYEAYQRFLEPPQIHSTGMLIVAILGLIVNFISMRLLQAGSESSLNMKGAYLEVWSDMLGSLGVIGAAVIIRFTGFWWIDPIVAVGIGLWVLPRTWLLLKQSLHILLEGVPEGLQLDQIETALRQAVGVTSVHDLHVWAITSGKVSLTAHLIVDEAQQDSDSVLVAINQILKDQFQITHSTIQIESVNCKDNADCNWGDTLSEH